MALVRDASGFLDRGALHDRRDWFGASGSAGARAEEIRVPLSSFFPSNPR